MFVLTILYVMFFSAAFIVEIIQEWDHQVAMKKLFFDADHEIALAALADPDPLSHPPRVIYFPIP